MIFCKLELSEDGQVTASAKGHGTEVLKAFHEVCTLLLGSRGAWRITDVTGACPDEAELDSDMRWMLIAAAKDRGV